METLRAVLGKDVPQERIRAVLEAANNNVEQAINLFFETEGTQQEARPAIPPTPIAIPPLKNTFRLVTWNIDGLNEAGLRSRAEGVCDELICLDPLPDAIHLQEVVDANSVVFDSFLKPLGFVCVSGREVKGLYYVQTWVNSATMAVREMTKEIVRLPTRMGRNMIAVTVATSQTPSTSINLLNIHLESTIEGINERKTQLTTLLDRLRSSSAKLSVYAGDTNLRDNELGPKQLQKDIKDAWVACGEDQSTRFTWDLKRNQNVKLPRAQPRLRFDRVLFRTHPPSASIRPLSFTLLGTNILTSNGLHPSDHFGICCDFSLE